MEEQEHHWWLNRNYCLSCYGKGLIDNTKPPSIGNTCNKCLGSGKRFHNQWLGGIIEE